MLTRIFQSETQSHCASPPAPLLWPHGPYARALLQPSPSHSAAGQPAFGASRGLAPPCLSNSPSPECACAVTGHSPCCHPVTSTTRRFNYRLHSSDFSYTKPLACSSRSPTRNPCYAVSRPVDSWRACALYSPPSTAFRLTPLSYIFSTTDNISTQPWNATVSRPTVKKLLSGQNFLRLT